VTASLVVLTPLAGVVAAACVLPLAAAWLAARNVARVRAALGLERPVGARAWSVPAALAAVVLLLALAAAQPAWRTTSERRVRADAQVFVAIDTSRSMLASASPAAPTRLARAKRLAIAIRQALPGVAVGVGTLTDRVLPNLLPSPDEAAFAATVREAVAIEQPPPAERNVKATTLAALAQVPPGGTFAPSARHRALVVLTDGESRPFDPAAVASALGRAPATALVLVQVWGADESIYGVDGTPEGAYRPDPAGRAALESLAAATGGTLVGEGRAGAAARAVRAALGSGPERAAGSERRTRSLGRWVALAALAPLALVLRRRNAVLGI
jgi:hypothetical protein